MFTIYEKLETSVEIEGTTYEINLAFNNIIKLLNLIKNPHLCDGQKIYIGIHMLLNTELDLEIEQQLHTRG